jgi:pimeloyl-ACP methyl ester carboxylesterase
MPRHRPKHGRQHASPHGHAPARAFYGDRDPFYPVEMAVEMYRAIPRSALWVVPNGGHGPVFTGAAGQFAETALAFLRT